MEDDRGVGDELADEGLVGDRAAHELGARRDHLGLAGEQVVEDGHLGALLDEVADEATADEAGPAGHEDPPAAEGTIRMEGHRLTPNRSRTAGRNRRHQSRIPRIFVKPSLAW